MTDHASLPDCLPECVAARDARNAMTRREKNAADFKRRRSGEAVFYATGCGETQIKTGADRRIVAPEWSPIKESQRDCGDGKGTVWIEHDPDIALTDGGCRAQRRIHRMGANSDWNVRAWGHMPLDWLEPRVNGAVLPIATNRMDPTLPKSRWNPSGKTVFRHGWIQWAAMYEESVLWKHPTYWLTPDVEKEFDAKGARVGLHVNKLVFPTGGQSSDQVAVNFGRLQGGIKTLFYNGNSTNGISPQLVRDLLVPNEWFTFEMLISDQIDPAANDDRVIKATERGGLGYPRFVALWMARYGEPAQLVGYTNHDPKNQGPAMIGSRLTDDRPLILKYQDANIDDYSLVPMVVLGPEQGFPSPTAGSFYAVRYIGARRLVKDGGAATSTRYITPKNCHFRPGRMENWGRGHVIGFSSGALVDYTPTRKDGAPLASSLLKAHMQFEIAGTSYSARAVAPDGVEDYAHRIDLAEPAPSAPRPGDCFMVSMAFARQHGTERLAGYPDSRYYYDQLICSGREIEFPHQPGVPLPKPWLE